MILNTNDITILYGVSSSWDLYISNNAGTPINVSSFDFRLTVDSLENPVGEETQLLELPNSVINNSLGQIRFSYYPDGLPVGDYYYKVEALDTSFRRSLITSGRFIVAERNVSLGTSALDWKADAVSGQIGQVFSITNTSGLYFYAGGPVYKDDTSGVTIVFSKAEEGYWQFNGVSSIDKTKPGGWLGSIRLQVSLDNGETLYDCGKILTSHVSSNPTGSESGPIFIVDSITNVAFVTKRGDYLYAYYGSDKNGTGTNDYAALAVARASYSAVIESALNKTVCPWYKYYNGTFTEPGIGGDATDLIKGYTLARLAHVAGFYSNELEKTVIVFGSTARVIHNNFFLIKGSEFYDNLFAIYSDDGINFSYPHKLKKSINTGMRYFSFVGPETYKGIGSKSLTGYTTSGFWGDWRNISVGTFSISASEDPIEEGFIGFSLGEYVTPFNIATTLDRGQLHKYVATLHKLQERKKLLEASAYYYNNPAEYVKDSSWRNVLQSYANSSTELSGNFPNQIEDYTRFEYGRDFHKLYKEYTNNFRRHSTSPTILNLDGPLVTAHTFGSVIYNSKFELNGSSAQTYPHLITSSLDNAKPLRYGEGVFTSAATASGTYTASSILNYGSSVSEYRNSGILSHIELCHTTGSSRDNEFTVIDIFGKSKASTRRNPLIGDNVLIRQVAKTGFSRLIFDISKYPVDSGYYANTTNFLTPNHEFKLSFNALIGDLDVVSMGGGAVGVWIHTKPELGKVWSFTKDMKWVQHDASGIRKDDVMSRYSHLVNIPEKVRSLEEAGIGPNKFKCAKVLDRNNPNVINDLVSTYSEKDFYKVEINFNTSNRTCDRNVITIPVDYINGISSDLHRLNQNYVIEIFTVPQQNNKFTLFYGLNMVDLTMNKMAKPYYSLLACGQEELRIEMLPEELLTIFKYFNQIAGDFDTGKIGNSAGYASRVLTITSGILESRGGSRINYVESPDWSPTTRNAENFIEGITIIN
jgi:hypothetical protein